jgi:hypothetical protein
MSRAGRPLFPRKQTQIEKRQTPETCQLRSSLYYLTIQPMTAIVRYLTHPQVKIDPAVPVPSWGLSVFGRTRTETLANTGSLSGTTQIISSGEQKAIETAEIIGRKLND